MLERTWVVTRRILRQLARDRRTLAVVVVQPVVIMAVFGYAFGADLSDVEVAVANLDRGTTGNAFVGAIDREAIDLVFYETERQVELAVQRQDARAGVVVPANFTRNVQSAGETTTYLVTYVDNTNVQVTATVLAEVAEALDATMESRTARAEPLVIETRPVFGGEDARTIDFLAPGVAAFAIFMLGSFLTVLALVKERTRGTLDRILVSPARAGEFVLGYALAFGTLAVLQAAVILAVATFLFGVEVRGSVLLALALTTLTGFVALGIGIFVSGLARNEQQAMQTQFLVAFPSLFLAGVFAPLEALPEFLRPLARLVPLTYAIEGLRAVVNRGAGLLEVAPDLLALGAFAAVFLGGAAFSFGRRRR